MFRIRELFVDDAPVRACDALERRIREDGPRQPRRRVVRDAAALRDLAPRLRRIGQIGADLTVAGIDGEQLALRAEDCLPEIATSLRSSQ